MKLVILNGKTLQVQRERSGHKPKYAGNNAWHNDKNHDAVWLVFKLVVPNGEGYYPLKLKTEGHHVVHNLKNNRLSPSFRVADDGSGIFIYPSTKGFRGDVAWRLRFELDTQFKESGWLQQRMSKSQLQIYGLEMVYIPAGGFTLGDPDTTALNFGAFYRSNDEGEFDGLIQIKDENTAIEIGKKKGQLAYRNGSPEYQGDMEGIIPASFPKGTKAFYIMKYELKQGEYTNFLNTLSNAGSFNRANFSGKDYYKNRGTIGLKNGKYIAEKPERACNYISWNDACAFADWAGLRPMTELEFTKACRGPNAPQAREYAWNTGNKNRLSRYVNAEGDLVWSQDLDESQLNDDNRDIFGASYYWVMDLSGGALWERCITIGNSKGRAFEGSHGDGRVSWYAYANNEDWPQGHPEDEGWGFRGGGFYYQNRQYGEFNPHSPIAFRRFGAWAGGNRSVAYGSRFVRTVN